MGFIVENNGLMEMDLETGEALIYNEYIDIPSIALAPDGDILIRHCRQKCRFVV